MVSIDGLVSGLDTASIVEGLLSLQQQQIDRLNLQKAEITEEQAAFKGIEAAIGGLQNAVSRLGSVRNNPFDARTTTVSDESALIATADTRATAGSYNLRVLSVARTHQIATNGFNSETDTITTGTMQIRVGNGEEFTVTIDDDNNTLQGLADQINAQSTDVSATIVDDGRGASDSYRLLLVSGKTGTRGELSITNSLADSSGSNTKPVFDLANPVQDATNATVRLGNGTGAIEVSQSSNVLSDILPGVTLDVLQADPNKDILLSIDHDTEGIRTAVKDFVDSFNGVTSFISEQSSFDPETQTAGLLLGNRSAIQIQNAITQAVSNVVGDLKSSANRLSTIGITFQGNGQLAFDSSALNEILSGENSEVGLQDLKSLFVLGGKTNVSGIEFISGTVSTDETADYEIDITTAAERASIVANIGTGSSITVTEGFNSLNLTVDGAAISLNLEPGTYDQDSFASMVQQNINSLEEMAGRDISISYEGSLLSITSNRYGSSSEVAIDSLSDGAMLMGFTSAIRDTGLDVAGVLKIGQREEELSGSGRLLLSTGIVLKDDDGNTVSSTDQNSQTALGQGLQIRVTLTENQIQSGVESPLKVTRGIAARLDRLLSEVTESARGEIRVADEVFDLRLESIDQRIGRLQSQFDTQQETLLARFAALENTISDLESSGNLLASQLGSLA